MQLGVQIPDFTFPGGPARLGADLAAVARAADDAGFSFIAVMDHFFQIPLIGPPEQPMLEAYTTLGFLAGVTSRIQLGAMVSAVTLRHPGMLIKQVTALDVLAWRADEQLTTAVNDEPEYLRALFNTESTWAASQSIGADK